MAFDGIITKSILAELNSCLIQGKINKIFEPNKNEILLGIYCGGKNYCLNICVDSTNYRLNLTTHSKQNPQNALNFCMVLRKHLSGGTIKRIYSNGLERIVFIDIDTYNDLNDLVSKTLIVELMGKHSNIILINSNSIIIDSLRHLNRFDNSNRDIFPGSKYENIISDKLDFTKVSSFEEFTSLLNLKSGDSISSTISIKFNGFGKNNILNLLDFLNIDDNYCNKTDLNLLYSNLSIMVNLLLTYNIKNYNILLNICKTNQKDYFLIIDDLSNYDFLNINFFIDDFYHGKEVSEQFNLYRTNVLKLVLNTVSKIKIKLKNIDKKIEECKKIDLYKLYGELLTANLYKLPNYPCKEVIVQNYYEQNKEVCIPLDIKFSPSQNAKMYFKKYRKLQNTIIIVSKQKELALAELDYLDSIVYEISQSETVSDIEAVYIEFCDTYLYKKDVNTVNNHINKHLNENKITKNKKSSFKKIKIDEPVISKYSFDDYTILLGKNNKQNDYLTCKIARNCDIWFHTKDIHGSHVVLKLNNTNISELSEVPESILYKCASIAAYHSKARISQNVPVDYTFVKYVKKPNGAKPGMVIYTNNKTIYVNPQNI